MPNLENLWPDFLKNTVLVSKPYIRDSYKEKDLGYNSPECY